MHMHATYQEEISSIMDCLSAVLANDSREFAVRVLDSISPNVRSVPMANFLVYLRSDLIGSDIGTGMTEGEWAEYQVAQA